MARFRRNRFPRIVALAELEPALLTLENVGSVALSMAEAARLGIATPNAWLLSAEVFRDAVQSQLPPAHDPASLLRIIHRPAGLERAARAWERLVALSLEESLLAELDGLTRLLSERARWGLRVRSSPTCGDASIAALASLEFEVLGVRGTRALEDAVRRVWASCVYADSLRTLRAHKLRDVATAVLIEPLEPVSASGILLTSYPRQSRSSFERERTDASTSSSGSIRVVSAALGLGAPVVDGASPRDLIRFSSTGEIVEARVAAKLEKCVVGDEGLVVQRVSQERASRPALKPKTLAELAEIADKLNALGEASRRVDFQVLRGGGVRVGSVHRSSGAAALEGGTVTTIWSRAGLGESLPGVLTPLTGSLAEAFEERGLRRALVSLGCKPPRGLGLVRRVHGRHYVNLSLLLPSLLDVPGIERHAFVELLAGQSDVFAEGLRASSSRGSLSRLPVTAARLLTQQRGITEEVQRFEREADQQRRWLAEMDLGILPDDSLKTTLLETHDFFQRTGHLLLSSSLAALAAHVGLKAVLGRSSPVLAGPLALTITSGVGDLETSALGVALCHVTAIAEKDAPARELLLTGKVQKPSDLPAGPARRALQHFLEAYGERALRESELMTPRFGEAPEAVLSMLVAGLSGEPVDPDVRMSSARVAADRELAALEVRLPYVEKVLVRSLVARSRVLLRLRERMRVWMARTLNMLRIVTLDVDRRLRRLDSTLTPGAAFFCTFGELVSAVGSYRADLGPVVRLRRATYERDANLIDPPETFVGAPGRLALPPIGSVVLHGTPASAGVVTGRARVVGPRSEDASHVRAGEILVVRSLDVGLAPLFWVAGGLVCELGSALSHGAVVAREYGLPAVVAVPSLTTTVQTGERLRIDGDRGIVERLDA
jgi:pyruvate,water dikinase